MVLAGRDPVDLVAAYGVGDRNRTRGGGAT